MNDVFLWPGDYWIGYYDNDGDFNKEAEQFGYGLEQELSDRPCNLTDVQVDLETIALAEASSCGCMVMVNPGS